MKITLGKKALFTTEIRFVFSNAAVGVSDFEAKINTTAVRYENRKTVIYSGLGDRAEFGDHVLRSAAATAIRKAGDLKRDRVSLLLIGISAAHTAAVEGVILGSYVFSKYQSEKPGPVNELQVVSDDLTTHDLDMVMAIGESVFLARDLVNENAATVNPAYLAETAKTIAKKPGFSVTVLDEKRLEKEGLGLLMAVGRGSATPPRLILIEYRGNPKTKQKTAVVGKGITFDSGGLNLKPSGSIETMREDMAGAAAVLGLMQLLSARRPKINVVGVIAAAHNAISASSYFPGDVYRSYSGKTVEICNTDAEGRLVLADAISYCIKNAKPTSIIDLATLTGAILTTFADVIAGLFSNNDEVARRLFEAGEKTHERLWRLPLYKEYSEAMKGDHSDLRNLATFKRGQASSITGAAFIREFCEDLPWAHLDIAGVAFNENEAKAEIPKYATGWGIRLLWEFLNSPASST